MTTSLPVLCTMLRTKTAFGSYSVEEDDTPWQAGESTTAAYWCLKTMETAGPDDDCAHPAACVQGRACYRPPIE